MNESRIICRNQNSNSFFYLFDFEHINSLVGEHMKQYKYFNKFYQAMDRQDEEGAKFLGTDIGQMLLAFLVYSPVILFVILLYIQNGGFW